MVESGPWGIPERLIERPQLNGVNFFQMIGCQLAFRGSKLFGLFNVHLNHSGSNYDNHVLTYILTLLGDNLLSVSQRLPATRDPMTINELS